MVVAVEVGVGSTPGSRLPAIGYNMCLSLTGRGVCFYACGARLVGFSSIYWSKSPPFAFVPRNSRILRRCVFLSPYNAPTQS